MLEIIKARLYIASTVTTFDEEIESLISSCKDDAIGSGINPLVFNDIDDKYDDFVLNLVTSYVKAYRGNERSDTDSYLKMYNQQKISMAMNKKYRAKFNYE